MSLSDSRPVRRPSQLAAKFGALRIESRNKDTKHAVKSSTMAFVARYCQSRAKARKQFLTRLTTRVESSIISQELIHKLNRKYDDAYGTVGFINARWETEPEKMANTMELELCELIYGSNFIESAGCGRGETAGLCLRAFRDEEVDRFVDSGDKHGENINVGRLEVIQHAKALKYFIERFVLNGEDVTEELILETHKTLCSGHKHDDGTRWEEWAGQYRTCEIAATSDGPTCAPSTPGESYISARDKRDLLKTSGIPRRKKTLFIRASAVPLYMATMVAEFNQEASNEKMDPFELASWICTQFVNIHPFADGNGRMCRILLNGVLLRYLGLVASIGEEGDTGRDQYLEIARATAKKYHEEDCEPGTKISHIRLTELVLDKVYGRGSIMAGLSVVPASALT